MTIGDERSYDTGKMQERFKEIKSEDLSPDAFIAEKTAEIAAIVGNSQAIAALSGGVDSSVVTMLAHRALGPRLKTYFIDNGLMRQNEPESVVELFKGLSVEVQLVDAQEIFFKALEGIADPEAKRIAIRQTFYQDVFGSLVKQSGAKFLFQGTNLTDIEETVAGIKTQHNVLEQMGIDPQQTFGYKIIEPLVSLRKDGVRKVAKALGLPSERIPFPGPALAVRVIGEVTLERIATVRQATAIVEEELAFSGAFQYLAILHKNLVTGMRDGKRAFGQQIEVRCWDSVDARIATPTNLSYEVLTKLAERIVTETSEVVSVTYNITPKPPSTMEAI